MWLLGDATEGADIPPRFREACNHFFCRWGLETLLTWDWPVPLEPDLHVGLRTDIDILSSSGMVLFVPWYLLRGGKLDLGEVARYRRLAAAPEHLRGWVDNREVGTADKLGDVRYTTVRWLYRFDELVLAKRYPAACKGNRQRLDQAFARVLGCEEDSVKKLQRRLQRVRLADAPNESSP
jgi:hypothetical protein